MTKIEVIIKTKVLEATINIEVITADRVSIERKLEDLMKLTGGKVYICAKCYKVYLSDEPMKEVYFARTDGTLTICEDCCADMGIFDAEILLNDLKRNNAKYVAFE